VIEMIIPPLALLKEGREVRTKKPPGLGPSGILSLFQFEL
jgi:hypothetical protein